MTTLFLAVAAEIPGDQALRRAEASALASAVIDIASKVPKP
jgi:hypothetical protein